MQTFAGRVRLNATDAIRALSHVGTRDKPWTADAVSWTNQSVHGTVHTQFRGRRTATAPQHWARVGWARYWEPRRRWRVAHERTTASSTVLQHGALLHINTLRLTEAHQDYPNGFDIDVYDAAICLASEPIRVARVALCARAPPGRRKKLGPNLQG